MVKKIFGGSEKRQQESSKSGYGAMPRYAQKFAKRTVDLAGNILDDPDQYYAPMELTEGELQAGGMLGTLADPEQASGLIESYLNPFRDIVFEDINRTFEQGPLANFQSGADAAGAFGGTRYNRGLYDLERARSDAIRGASAQMYGSAYNQLQDAIGGLMDFGGQERRVDLARRQALPQALGMGVNVYSPLLQSRQSQGTMRGDTYNSAFKQMFPLGL